MHVQNLIEIHNLIHKILSINKLLMSIKGHNSVKNWPKIICIRYIMDLVYSNAYTKFIKIHPFVDIKEKHIFTISRAITLLFIYEFSPFAIPNHSSFISMSIQSLKKIGQNLLKLESGNEALTDGWTLKRFGGYNILLPFVWRGIKSFNFYTIASVDDSNTDESNRKLP